MNYKLFISTAGIGSRIKSNFYLNKSLLPINRVAVLSKIIEKFPIKIEIVLALGHQGKIVKEYVKFYHPDRKIKFINIKNYNQKGSGPGLSLLQAKNYLQCPFIYSSCDTLISGKPKNPLQNWIGISKVKKPDDYLVLENIKNKIVIFDKKKKSQINKKKKKFNAFIGLMGIKDYELFWKDISNNKKLINKEFQISNGLENILRKSKIINYKWYDTGTNENYRKTQNSFKDRNIRKENETIYIKEKKLVIKYFKDGSKVKKLKRRCKQLKPFSPTIVNSSNNFLVYKYIKGKLLSEISAVEFSYLLDEVMNKFWLKNYRKISDLDFKNLNKKFYQKKTYDRVNKFFLINNLKDTTNYINGIKVQSVFNMLNKLNWNSICTGVQTNFHGDFQPENIIYNKKKISFIDWRDDFGGNLNIGDLYYEFAKLEHALIINGGKIRNGKYKIEIKNNIINYSFQKKSKLIKFRTIFHKFLSSHNFDIDKVKLLSILIYLNIAPLHEQPYSNLLYYHGKLSLFNLINEKKK